MTKRELERLVRWWQQSLGLGRHEISIEWDVDEDGREAGVLRSAPRWPTTTARSSGSTRGSTPEWSESEANRTVAHELLHVLLRDVEYVLFKQLEGQLHRDVYSVIERAHTHYLEQAIDRLATRLVEISGVTD